MSLGWVNFEMRVLIENRFYGFQEEMGISRFEAIGILVQFWGSSQGEKTWEGTREEILHFVPLLGAKKEKCFQALISNKYVSENKDGLFTIRGNRKHIEAVQAFRDKKRSAGKIGGKKRAENHQKRAKKAQSKVNEINNLVAEPKQTQANASQVQVQVQYNNSKELLAAAPPRVAEPHENFLPDFDKPLQDPPIRPPELKQPVYEPPREAPRKRAALTEKQKLGMRVDTARKVYVTAFRDRYRTADDPHVGGKERGILGRVITALGVDRTCDLLRIYLREKDPYWEKMGHTITEFERSLNKIILAEKRAPKKKYTFEDPEGV